MSLKSVLTAILLLAAPSVQAGSDFGTREEAQRLASALIDIVEADGIEAAVEAMHDRDHPFVTSRMGVNLFQNSTVIADNREPEMVATDYSHIADLTGTIVWPIIDDAARIEDDAVLKWYHYETQEEYVYDCFSKRSMRDDATVMVCR